ncbi:MAG: hypothetical protein OEY89_08810 [Gammaproteobacteria bacterium]|nr:hypothetical protein [Gammaproteobacteria bacterium]
MLKLRHNKTLLFFLITAFLTVQWAAVHIHLAEHHNHNGNHHQHNIQAHAHKVSSHHVDGIDFAHVTDDYNVVELDNDCASPGWKKTGDQLAVSMSVVYQLLFVSHSIGTLISEQDSNKQSYIAYSTIRLRAPPQFS